MVRTYTVVTVTCANYALLGAAIKVACAGRVHRVVNITSDATNIYALIELR